MTDPALNAILRMAANRVADAKAGIARCPSLAAARDDFEAVVSYVIEQGYSGDDVVEVLGLTPEQDVDAARRANRT